MTGCKGVDRHRGDEAIAPAAHGLDVALGLARIAQGFAGLGYTVRQRLIRHKLLGPQVRHQLVLRHGPVGSLDEVG